MAIRRALTSIVVARISAGMTVLGCLATRRLVRPSRNLRSGRHRGIEISYRRWSRAGRGCGGRRVARVLASRVALDKLMHDGGRPGHVAAVGLRLQFGGLPGFEVAGVLVNVDPGTQARCVQFGMELRGIDMGADPERLHRASGGLGKQDGVPRQHANGLFVGQDLHGPSVVGDLVIRVSGS